MNGFPVEVPERIQEKVHGGAPERNPKRTERVLLECAGGFP